MDAVDPALAARADQAVRAVPGVLDVRVLRMRWLGHRLRAEIDLVVDGAVSAVQAHGTAHAAERAVRAVLPKLDEASVHAYPGAAHRATVAGPGSG